MLSECCHRERKPKFSALLGSTQEYFTFILDCESGSESRNLKEECLHNFSIVLYFCMHSD